MAYTYRIGWTKLKLWYYGVRYAKGCMPSDLFVTYFTSSKEVRKIMELHGKPDCIEIRKTFNNRNDALIWEHKVLKRMNVINRDDYLNKTDNKAIGLTPDDYRRIGEKTRKALRGRPKSREHIEKIKATRKERPYRHTSETKKKISENSKNLSKESLTKRSIAMTKKKWANNGLINKRFDIIPKGWTAGRLNLKRSPMSEESKNQFRIKRCKNTHIVFRNIEYLSLRDAENQTGISRHLIKKELSS